MSQNTGCSGKIVIPKKEFSKLTRSIIEEYNQIHERDVERFNREVIDVVLEEQKGKRNVDWTLALQNKVYQLYPQNGYNPIEYFTTFHPEIQASIVGFDTKKDKTKIKRIKPKKVKMTTTDPNVFLAFGSDAEFRINKEEVAIFIYVAFNNHNLEHAQSNTFYKSTIKKLRSIEYTKNTGGHISAQEETDYDCTGEHDRSYILMEFNPPATKKKNTLK